MVWVSFALLTAVFESFRDLFSKGSLRNCDEHLVAWSITSLALPFLLPILLFIEIPALDAVFWMTLACSAPLQAVGWLCYVRAIKSSELSLTVPLVMFTPLFLLFTSPLMIGEYPAPLGIAGVACTVLGSYLLNINQYHRGPLAPFAALFRESGPRYMLATAFIWSITSNLDKIGILHSSTFFWGPAVYAAISLILTASILCRKESRLADAPRLARNLVPVGASTAAMVVCHFIAISTGLVIYVICIKRLSVLLTGLWGHLFFDEHDFRQRLGAAAVMLLGVVFIVGSF